MSRERSIATLLMTGLSFSWGLAGCGSKTTPKERQAFSHLYAEILIADNQLGNDSSRLQRKIDSLLVGTEFRNKTEVKEWLEELTIEDPQGLQEVLDSTQKYLEGVRNNQTK